MKSKYKYLGFGLQIESEVELTALSEASDDAVDALISDVFIKYGKISDSIDANECVQMHKGRFQLTIPNVAKYLVIDGNEVIVEPLTDRSNPDIALFLTCSVFGALFHQRGLLALHSSVIKVGDRCAVFCGNSGAGKSTLAKEFLKRGYSLQGDDLGVVWPNKQSKKGLPLVYPAYPHMKLWSESLEHLGEGIKSFNRLRPGMDKYSVPVHDNFHMKPLSLGKIYVLSYADVDAPEIEVLKGADKIVLLTEQTYRAEYMTGLECEKSHFKTISELAGKVEVVRLIRPRGFDHMDRIITFLEADFESWLK